MKCPTDVRQHAHRRSDIEDRRMGVWYREEDKTWLVAPVHCSVPNASIVLLVDSEDILEKYEDTE